MQRLVRFTLPYDVLEAFDQTDAIWGLAQTLKFVGVGLLQFDVEAKTCAKSIASAVDIEQLMRAGLKKKMAIHLSTMYPKECVTHANGRLHGLASHFGGISHLLVSEKGNIGEFSAHHFAEMMAVMR